jgi:sorbitol-6-phosphate 2-dehydrogenase
MGGWLKLEGKVAVVTGGGSGIGRACCEALAENGAKVVVADRDKAMGSEVAGRLQREKGVPTLFHETDVTRSQDAAALMAAAAQAFGGVDILVNNAGINIPRLLVDPAGKEELTDDVLQRMLGVNLNGVVFCAREAARAMLSGRRAGVIINMTSESGLEGSEGQSAYSATKAALHGLTRSWAKELGRLGVRVVGVAPGILEATGLRSDAYEKALAYTRGITVEDLQKGYVKTSTIPLGRAGRLSEVADLVAFLASERASYVHGTVINISGGKTRG